MDRLAVDIRVALRTLRRTPAFTVTAVIILALGIGMATAMLTIFRVVVVSTLPVSNADRIVNLWAFREQSVDLAFSVSELHEFSRQTRTLQGVAGVVHWGAQPWPTTEGGRELGLKQAMVTSNYFDILGAQPVLGRLLRADDGLQGAAPVAVISYRTWQSKFGGDPHVLDRQLTTSYDQVRFAIVGVASPGLDYPVGADYWIRARPVDLLNVVARLQPNATPAAAQSEFLGIATRLAPQFGNPPVIPTSAKVQGFTQAVVGNVRPTLVTLTAAVALLLLIACVNVGNLLLLRASLRAHELVVRRALGASYAQVARLLLVESALLGIAGGAFGLLCAEALLRTLLAFAPEQLPRTDMIRLAGVPASVAAGVMLLAILLFGVVPALVAARGDLASGLRLDSRSGSETRQRRRIRQTLVATQMALALMMLTGAGLLVRSLERLERIDLGYTSDHLSVISLAIPFTNYGSDPKVAAMLEGLYGRVRAVPGITALTPMLYPPFVGANLWQTRPELEGQSAAESEANVAVPLEFGGVEYFRAFRIPILRGRGFTDADRRNAPGVVVVSEAEAQRFWPGVDPIGKRIRFPGDGTTEWRTVVGIAGETRLRRLSEPTPMMYLPWLQTTTFGTFAVRTRGDLSSVLPAIRRTISDTDPAIEVWNAKTMDDWLAGPLAQPRLSALLLSAFGLVALLLAAVGLYGVMASLVRERTREIGIRTALGATPERMRRDVLAQSLAVCGTGVLVGAGCALATTRVLKSQLFQVSPTDPIVLAGACGLLLAVALIAAYLPARRATRIDPAQALRVE